MEQVPGDADRQVATAHGSHCDDRAPAGELAPHTLAAVAQDGSGDDGGHPQAAGGSVGAGAQWCQACLEDMLWVDFLREEGLPACTPYDLQLDGGDSEADECGWMENDGGWCGVEYDAWDVALCHIGSGTRAPPCPCATAVGGCAGVGTPPLARAPAGVALLRRGTQ